MAKKNELVSDNSFYILNHSPIGHLVIDDQFSVCSWNRCLENWTGISESEIIGSNLLEHYPHLKSKQFYLRIQSTMKGGPPSIFSSQIHKYFLPCSLPGEKKRIQSATVTKLPDVDGISRVIISIQDFTSLTVALENKKNTLNSLKAEIKIRTEIEKQLNNLALHDSLTGLANRNLFHDFFLNTITRCKRNNTTFALFFLDLDHFKEINDTLGHQIGDLVLKEVANRLKQKFRGNDLIARLGGDEFAIIVDGSDSKSAEIVAKAVVESLSMPLILEGNSIVITTSMGITIYPKDGLNQKDLIHGADQAMYVVKKQGRNNFCFYDKKVANINPVCAPITEIDTLVH